MAGVAGGGTVHPGQIEPPVASVDGTHARVELSFGPNAVIVPTKDGCGFTVMILRASPGPFSEPVLWARVTFGPDLKPTIEGIKVTNDG